MRENELFNSIMTGLNEAVEDANGEKPIMKREKITAEPVKDNDGAVGQVSQKPW